MITSKTLEISVHRDFGIRAVGIALDEVRRGFPDCETLLKDKKCLDLEVLNFTSKDENFIVTVKASLSDS
jgi:hypothetical protein